MPAPETRGPYVIEHGDVWFVEGPRTVLSSGLRHVCGPSDMLAVAYTEEEDGLDTVHKHGAETMVAAWADKQRRAYAAAGFQDMAEAVVVLAFPPVPEAVAELNALTRNSGGLRAFKARLGGGHALPGEEEAPSLPGPR